MNDKTDSQINAAKMQILERSSKNMVYSSDVKMKVEKPITIRAIAKPIVRDIDQSALVADLVEAS
jgi:hypothetical protein